MRVSAVQKFTTLDLPDRLSCIVFTPGCNFRCGYCHNPEFVLPEQLIKLQHSFIDESTVFSFLNTRIGKLDCVVISGGEPTLQRGLDDFLKRVKEMGFQTKLDTNGSLPDILKPLLENNLVDYVAMDVKTSLERYGELVGACIRPEAIKQSIKLVKTLAPEYEFRTTILNENHDEDTLKLMAEMLDGVKRYALQGFRPAKTLDTAYASYKPVSESELNSIASFFAGRVEEVLLRV